MLRLLSRPSVPLVAGFFLAACGRSPFDAPEPTIDTSDPSPVASPNPPVASAPIAPAASSSTPAAVDDAPRIYSKRRHAWIFYEPAASNGWAGFLGLGSSVRLRSTQSRVGDGCAAFYPVEPRGWVCLNEKTTLDPNEPEYVAIKKFAPKLDQPFPHNYGESRGTPRYTEVPTREQQLQREYKLAEHLDQVELMRNAGIPEDKVPKSLRGVDLSPAGHGVPPELALFPRGIQESRDYLKPLSTVAWSHQFDAEGRTWLVTADLALVPKDRVTPYPRSTFHGVHLRDGAALPIAFVRDSPKPQYRKSDADTVAPTGSQWPRLAFFPIHDREPLRVGETDYYQAVEGDLLVASNDVTVARLSPTTPWGAPVQGAQPPAADAPVQRVPPPQGGRRTWIEVSVLGGWMVAYEDTRAVYATLIAPGRGGIPARGIDPLETASTPVGTFRVDGKFFTATMANEAFVHSDVPFSQNFHGPHVLHQAYWHDGWGEKRSAGCINLAPIDALWFFHWSEPPIPEGWFGMRSDKEAGPATIVYVHR